MLAHHKHIATTPGRKRTRPAVGQIGPSAALRHLPDAPHRAARRAWPNEPICTHQIDSYLPRTALVRLCRNSRALAIDARGLEVRRAASPGGAALSAWRRHGERRSARRHRTRRPSARHPRARHQGIGRGGRRQRHPGSIPAPSAMLVRSPRGVFGGIGNVGESTGHFRHCPAMSPSCRASV